MYDCWGRLVMQHFARFQGRIQKRAVGAAARSREVSWKFHVVFFVRSRVGALFEIMFPTRESPHLRKTWVRPRLPSKNNFLTKELRDDMAGFFTLRREFLRIFDTTLVSS